MRTAVGKAAWGLVLGLALFGSGASGYIGVQSFTFQALSRFDGSAVDNTEFSEIQSEGVETAVTAIPTVGQVGASDPRPSADPCRRPGAAAFLAGPHCPSNPRSL